MPQPPSVSVSEGTIDTLQPVSVSLAGVFDGAFGSFRTDLVRWGDRGFENNRNEMVNFQMARFVGESLYAGSLILLHRTSRISQGSHVPYTHNTGDQRRAAARIPDDLLSPQF